MILSPKNANQELLMEVDNSCIENIFREDIIKHLIDISVLNLRKMYNLESGLFSYRSTYQNNSFINKGESLRYTIISLLGLYNYEKHSTGNIFFVNKCVSKLLDKNIEPKYLGDIGLFLWLLSLVCPKYTEEYLNKYNILTNYDRFTDYKNRNTMELSWFLSGLCNVASVLPDYKSKLEELSGIIRSDLLNNYGGVGLFGHVGKNIYELFSKRSRIGSFADQVYPIQALTFFNDTFQDKHALDVALECAGKICQLQGPLGQWWWHYDALRGDIAGHYPVYSVHQYGMAPMALLPLQNIININVREHVEKGIDWLIGKNELNIEMIDKEKEVVWRNIHLNWFDKYFDLINSIYNYKMQLNFKNRLNVLYECRSYCYGWLLYGLTSTHFVNNNVK